MRKILLVLMILLSVSFIVPTSAYAVSKVYRVDVEQLFQWLKGKHGLLVVKPIKTGSRCFADQSGLRVADFLDSSGQFHNSYCRFELFRGVTLSAGWQVQRWQILSNGRGQWHYIINPQHSQNLYTVVELSSQTRHKEDIHLLKFKSLFLSGPLDSSSWKEAFGNRK